MNWIESKKCTPTKSASYLVCLKIDNYNFHYIAYFDTNTKEWYKFDPFNNKPITNESITLYVNYYLPKLPIMT